MPLPTQLRSCSMRSGVQVAFEGGIRCGTCATIAESIAGAVGAIGGIGGDEVGSDGAIDGDMERPRLLPRPVWAADRAFVRAQRATARRKPRSENRCAASRADPEKDAPDVTQAGGSRSAEKNQPHQATTPHFTEPHPASRMANPLLEWRPYALLNRGRFLTLLSENPRRLEASHDSTRLPRVKMPL